MTARQEVAGAGCAIGGAAAGGLIDATLITWAGVAGLSGPVITSALATIGGSMVGGLAIVAAIPMGLAATGCIGYRVYQPQREREVAHGSSG